MVSYHIFVVIVTMKFSIQILSFTDYTINITILNLKTFPSDRIYLTLNHLNLAIMQHLRNKIRTISENCEYYKQETSASVHEAVDEAEVQA